MKATLIFAFLASVYPYIAVGSAVLSKRRNENFSENNGLIHCDGTTYTYMDAYESAEVAYDRFRDCVDFLDCPLQTYEATSETYPGHNEPFLIFPMLTNGLYPPILPTTDFIILDDDFNLADVLSSNYESCEMEDA